MRILITIGWCIALISGLSAQDVTHRIILRGNGSVLSDSVTASKQYADGLFDNAINAIRDTATVLRAEESDDQTIDEFSLSGNTLSLSLEDDGEAAQTVDLSIFNNNIGNADQVLLEERTISLNNNPLNYESISSVDMRYDASIGSGNIPLFDLSFRNDNFIANENIAQLSIQTDDSRRNGRFVFKTGDGGVLSDVLTIDRRKRVGINTTEPGQSLDIAEGTIRLQEFGAGTEIGPYTYLLGVEADGDVIEVSEATIGYVSPPASSSSTCTAGQWSYDSTHSFRCIATNTWRRVAHSSW